jgi:hypothetical protein
MEMEKYNPKMQSDIEWLKFADVLVDTGVITDWIQQQGGESSQTKH